LLIKYIKSALWRLAKRLSNIEDARYLKVNVQRNSCNKVCCDGNRKGHPKSKVITCMLLFKQQLVCGVSIFRKAKTVTCICTDCGTGLSLIFDYCRCVDLMESNTCISLNISQTSTVIFCY
jgi:hypothetical protein